MVTRSAQQIAARMRFFSVMNHTFMYFFAIRRQACMSKSCIYSGRSLKKSARTKSDHNQGFRRGLERQRPALARMLDTQSLREPQLCQIASQKRLSVEPVILIYFILFLSTMAKSLRSKVKRHFRSQKAAVVDAHPHVQSKEAKRQAILDRARSAPKKKTDEAAMDVVDEVENEEMEQSDDEQQQCVSEEGVGTRCLA